MRISRMSESATGKLSISQREQLVQGDRLLASTNTPEQVISWLNIGRKTPAKNRIARIVQLLQQQRAIVSFHRVKTGAERQRQLRLAFESGNALELDDLLARYWVSPRVFFVPEGPRMLYATTDPSGKPRDKVERDEITAAMCVMHLAVRDELDRVRKCDCRKFFLAGRLDQIYCSTNCRVRYYQSSEEFKAKRRTYLRELYRLKKRRGEI
jgi:hypothetical protein